MAAGRTPLPTSVHDLRGFPGKRPKNHEEPQTEPLDAAPPTSLDDEGKKFWEKLHSIVTAMNVAQKSDGPALEILAMCLAEARRAYEDFRDCRTVTFESGAEQVSPYFTIWSKLIAQAMKIMTEFGMTPASRTRVKQLATKKKANPLADFLNDHTDVQ